MSGYADNNPKTIYGSRKPDMSLIPPAALVYLALGFGNGADKYGPYNWREKQVAARVYVAAAMRHLASFLDGYDNDTSQNGSGLPHLAHAMASMAIIIDAIETGNLIDDRPKHGTAEVLIDKWTKTSVVPPTPRMEAVDAAKPKAKAKAKKGKSNGR